eukprot:gnl/MRDRNA2_/MRDRNA2_88045_c0_seq1.p1 gnl/MRDRNA2_/MRDRNA2_88045_c0~~gnl/MRDRNA2_/MRDRNA2_88045_c0_seq1.p1  ORF type:complete len:209 (+),score=51.80 gnl/MRDRNA2_/MRDRNA2_88045_c0_seq1:101-727(+)
MAVAGCMEAEDLVRQMELQLDSSDLILNSVVGPLHTAGHGGTTTKTADAGEVKELRKSLKKAEERNTILEEENAKILRHLSEVQKAYELLKELAERQGLGKEVRNLGRESMLEAWLARGVFQRLYQDAIDRWGRAEDRARRQHRVELSNFVRKMESLFEYTTDDLVMEISPKLWSPRQEDGINFLAVDGNATLPRAPAPTPQEEATTK